MKKSIGVINLGCIPGGDYWNSFISNLKSVIDLNFWEVKSEGHPERGRFGYREIDFDFTDAYDALVLSPGDAKIGLRTPDREPEVGGLYDLIDRAIAKNVPIFGINAGYQALNSAHGKVLRKLSDTEKENLNREQEISLSSVDNNIVGGVDSLIVKIGSGYVVSGNSEEMRKDSVMRQKQDSVNHLVSIGNVPIISCFGEGLACGSQANIQYVHPIVINFFNMAKASLEGRV